jgi:hypothetical protein
LLDQPLYRPFIREFISLSKLILQVLEYTDGVPGGSSRQFYRMVSDVAVHPPLGLPWWSVKHHFFFAL